LLIINSKGDKFSFIYFTFDAVMIKKVTKAQECDATGDEYGAIADQQTNIDAGI
jgi:hypothetical protein